MGCVPVSGYDKLQWFPIDPEAFTIKEYPECSCERKFIPKLGCMWCQDLFSKREFMFEQVPRCETCLTPMVVSNCFKETKKFCSKECKTRAPRKVAHLTESMV